MSAIGGHRAVEGSGGGLCVRVSQHRNATHGRQGKRPAFGAAYMVGEIEGFANIADTPAGALHDFPNEINRPSAVCLYRIRISAHGSA